ncbi:SGNH hydrolase domain-containing protein, partial [Microbacterium gubbeenense]
PGSDQSDCVVTGESLEIHSNDITRAAAEAAGASYIATAEFVCAEDGCPLFAGDTPLYEDDSHLNRLWVEHLAPAFGRELVAMLDD